MQSDRQLLKMAAKAAALDVFWRGTPGMLKPMVVLPFGDVRPWNSFESDGDAFLLQVRLKMNVFHAAGSVYALDEEGEIEVKVSYDAFGGDEAKAARDAVTRCAAAMAEE